MKKLILLLVLIFLVSCSESIEEKSFDKKGEEEIKTVEITEPAYTINAPEKSVHDMIFTGEPLTKEIIELANSKPATDGNERAIGTGGDEFHHFYYVGTIDLDSVPYTLFDATGKEYSEIYEWINSDEWRSPIPTSLDEYMNVRSFINHFEIPEDIAKEAILAGRPRATEEQADMLINGSDNEVMNYFSLGYSIIIGDKYYSPSWLLNESVEKWREVGITKEMLLDKVEIYSSGLYSITRDRMSAKFSEFFGSKVELKTVEEIVEDGFFMTVNKTTYSLKELNDMTINEMADLGITSKMLIDLQSEMKGYENTKAYDSLNGAVLLLSPRQTVFGKPKPDAELPVVPDEPEVTE